MPVSRRSRYGPHSAAAHVPCLVQEERNRQNVSVSQSEPDLSTMTKDQLKAECRRRGQKTTGTKTELVLLSSKAFML